MKFCVIGVGRFGFHVATTLADNRMEVLAVDNNESIIAAIRDKVTEALCMRVTDEKALRAIGVETMDTVIVAMGENFAESILVTALLKQKLNVPKVIARAVSEIHQEILYLVGADQVVLPEREMGVRLADALSLPFNALVRIGPDYSISEQQTPQRFVGKTFGSLHLPEIYHVQCIGRKREDMIIPIDSDYTIEEDDILVLAGLHRDLAKMAKL